jgi:hypothetical protein
VLDEDLLVVELAVAVVAEDLVDALLLLPHRTPFDAWVSLPLPPSLGGAARRGLR